MRPKSWVSEIAGLVPLGSTLAVDDAMFAVVTENGELALVTPDGYETVVEISDLAGNGVTLPLSETVP